MANRSVTAGWYPDHVDSSLDRWWDGCEWTTTTRPSGSSTNESTTVVRAVDGAFLADTTARDTPRFHNEPMTPLSGLAPPTGQPLQLAADSDSRREQAVGDQQTGWIPVVEPPPATATWTAQHQTSGLLPSEASTNRSAGFSPPAWLLGCLVGLVVVLVGAVAFMVTAGSKNSNVLADGQSLATTTSATSTTTTTTTLLATTIPPAPPQTVIVEVPQRQTVRPEPVDPCVEDPWQCEGDVVGFETSAPSGAPFFFDNDAANYLATGWIVQFASFKATDPSSSDAADNSVADLRSAGEEAFVLWSGDFSSLTNGYWVVVNNLSFGSGEDAAAHCRAIGRYDKDSCLGRYLSFDSADSKLMVLP